MSPSWTYHSMAVLATTMLFFFSSRRRHTRSLCDWSSDVCSSDLIHEKGNFLGAHGEQDDLFVQHFVVLEVMQQGEWRPGPVARHVNGGAGHATNALVFQAGEKSVERQADVAEALAQNTTAFSPGQHEEKDRGRGEKREPAAVRDLDHVRAKKCEVDADEESGHGRGRGDRPVPAAAGHDIKQNRRDQHGRGNRDAVSCGEMARRSKAEDESD